MAESHVVSGLVAKRAEISGVIARYQQELAKMQADVQHLDASIKLFDPDYDLRTIRATAFRQRNQYFGRGEGHRLMLEALRELGGQGNAVQISKIIVARKGFDASWQGGVHHCMDGILRRAVKSGVIRQAGKDETGNLWQLVELASTDQQLG